MYCPACHQQAETTTKGLEAMDAATISTDFVQLKEQRKVSSAGAGRRRRPRKSASSLTLRLPRRRRIPTLFPGDTYNLRFVFEDELVVEERVTIPE